MGQTKSKLANDQPALGAWIMIGHPTVAEIFAGEGFDWIAVDMEHTSADLGTFHELALAVKGCDVDLLVRLQDCDPIQAKRVLDTGANGIIVPMVNTPEQARQAVAMATYPPQGVRGASFVRSADYGRNFADYFANHNDNVIVVVMLEHIDAANNADAILSTPGISACFIGPYDLSASMGLAGQLQHPDVLAAQQKILDAAKKNNVPAGFHVIPVDVDEINRRIAAGYRFIGCSMDQQMLIESSRSLLKKVNRNG